MIISRSQSPNPQTQPRPFQVSAFCLIHAGRRIRQTKEMSMKDQGMPLGDFRFCFPYQPCSQELKVRLAALNAVTGAQIHANLARAARVAEMERLEAIDQRVKAQLKAEAHDRIGQSMVLASWIRGAGPAPPPA
jgi:hypothetical protein